MNLTHNHQMVDEHHRFFMSNERSIPDNVKQRIELLRHAGVDVPTIRAILKEEFGDCVTRDVSVRSYRSSVLKTGL